MSEYEKNFRVQGEVWFEDEKANHKINIEWSNIDGGELLMAMVMVVKAVSSESGISMDTFANAITLAEKEFDNATT